MEGREDLRRSVTGMLRQVMPCKAVCCLNGHTFGDFSLSVVHADKSLLHYRSPFNCLNLSANLSLCAA